MADMKLKILHLVQRYYPDIGGMEEVVKQISEHMVTFGHEIHVATSISEQNSTPFQEKNGVFVHRFPIKGNIVDGIKGNVKPFEDLLRDEHFNVIVVFAAQQWSCDLFLNNIEKINSIKIFVPTGFSGLNSPKYRNYYEMLSKKIQLFNFCIFHSSTSQDYLFAKKNGIENLKVIPNGASDKEFESLTWSPDVISNMKISKNDFVVISIGNHTGLKGHHEAIQIFKKSSLPKNSKLFIIGKSFFPNPCIIECKLKSWINNIFNKRKIFVLNLERENLIHLLKRADLMLFPSNIECAPIVISEAIASNTYYLASEVGNIKEMIQQFGNGKLLPTFKNARGFASVDIDSSAQILTEAHKLLSSQRRNAQKNPLKLPTISWKSISMRYIDTYLEAINLQKNQ